MSKTEEVGRRCAQLKAKLERLRNPVPKPLRIPNTPQLKLGDPINRDLARLSFHRERRTKAMVQRVADKYGVAISHVYYLLRVYEATHTLEFPGDPANHWKGVVAFIETGVVTSGNRRVSPSKIL